MADRPWKKWERQVAALIGGGRYPANSGHRIDCGPDADHPMCGFMAQAKQVTRLSLEELTALAEEMEPLAGSLIGVVAVKVRRGKGQPSPGLIVMTTTMWERLMARLRC